MTTRWTPALAAAIALLSGAATAAPRSQPPAAQAHAEPPAIYRVKAGDTLYDLATLYFVRQSDAYVVQRLNRVANPRRMAVGRKLTIPAVLLRDQPIVGRLVAFSGPVTIEGPGVAGPVRRNMTVREGYLLATGPNAFLTFELPDGSHTTLPSQSRIRVERLRRVLLNGALQRDLRLEDGRSAFQVTPMTEPGSRFRIRTPLTVSAVRGTEFRVNHDARAGRSTLEVIEGEVGQGSGRDETLVAAGYGLGATAAGFSETRPLPPPPRLADPAKLQDDPTLAFALAPQAGAVGYRAQVARDAGFLDVLAEATSEGPELGFPGLANGTYFARFTALDGAGLEGLPAAYAFERRLNALGLDIPTLVSGARRQYLFKWRSTGGAPESFRFVLGREPDGGGAMIDQAGLAERQLVVTDLPPGVYYWRVLVTRREDGRVFEKWAAPQRFEIGG